MTEAVKKEDPPTAAETAEKEETKSEEAKKEPDEKDILKSVAERLQFFFSDANIRQDNFMRNLLMSEDGGSVPVESLLRFNTIKKYTSDPEIVAKAVKEHLSEKLKLQDDDKAVARVKPFTKDLLSENIPLSLYVENLPVKEVEGHNGRKNVVYDVAIDDIRKLFEQYGEVTLVKLRFKSSAYSKDDDHTDDIKTEEKDTGGRKPRRRYPFKSCLVEFENREAQAKAAEDVLTLKDGEKVEPKRKLEVNGQALEVMSLQEFLDNLKKKRKRNRDEDGDGGKEESDEAEKFTIEWKPGCVVSLKGLSEDCDREAIMDAVFKACEIDKKEAREKQIFADYSRGQKDGAIRFSEPELAAKMLEKLKSGDAKICDAKVEEVSLLEGDGEKKYWEDYIEFRRKQIKHRMEERKHKGHNKRRKGGGRNSNSNKEEYQTMQS